MCCPTWTYASPWLFNADLVVTSSHLIFLRDIEIDTRDDWDPWDVSILVEEMFIPDVEVFCLRLAEMLS